VYSSRSQEVKKSVVRFLVNLRVHHSRTLKVLEILVDIHAPLLMDLVPDITRAVIECETKRGVGIDKQIRLSHCVSCGAGGGGRRLLCVPYLNTYGISNRTGHIGNIFTQETINKFIV